MQSCRRNLVVGRGFALLWAVFVAMLCGWLAACSGDAPRGVDDPQRSVYYWRTTLRLDSAERAFVSEAEVRKVYLHLFDVERNSAGELVPGNTLLFEDTLPSGVDVIPTVFVAPRALRNSAGVAELPQLIWKRASQMLTQNGYPSPREIQIDYDWTQSDASCYFDMLARLHELVAKDGARLSATIRLHQLAMKVPPVDYGVLMVYNVGDFRSYDEANSILSRKGVEPYLNRLAAYDLPLCAALPVFGWDLLFHRGQFVRLLRGVDVADTACFERLDSVHYRCQQYMSPSQGGVTDEGRQRLYPGDEIRHEQCSAALLREVRDMLEKRRPGICSQTVLYHLDNKQLKRYDKDEIKSLFGGH